MASPGFRVGGANMGDLGTVGSLEAKPFLDFSLVIIIKFILN